MKLLGSMATVFSMYSKISVSQVERTKKRMKYAMCFFPLVGAAQGILLYAFALLVWKWEFWVFYYVGGVALPILVNGGIHMDGFLDVVDARASSGNREKKLEILRGPHVGSFAILGAIAYVLLYLGIFVGLPAVFLPAVGGIYVLTRAMSGLSVVWFPKAKNNGPATAFSEDAQRKTVAVTMFPSMAASLCLILWIAGTVAGILCALVALAIYAYYYRVSIKELGGITGDLAGHFLQIRELVLITALAVSLRIRG